MEIQLINLSKKFDGKQVFQNINVTFLEGRMNCLMGSSGAGKTTLMYILMGLVKPDSGEINGLTGKRIAAVFQEDRLIEHWNAVQNVKLVGDRSLMEERIKEHLQMVGLDVDTDKPVLNYSGGMRRRVTIVRAMLAKSDLIILDEPFKGLDDLIKKQVIAYVKQNSLGKTMIVVTHNKEDVQLLDANLVIL